MSERLSETEEETTLAFDLLTLALFCMKVVIGSVWMAWHGLAWLKMMYDHNILGMRDER